MMGRPPVGTGTILRELRAKAGKRAVEIAHELGIDPSNIRHWEAGRYKIRQARAEAVAKAYGCDIADIRHLVHWLAEPAAPPEPEPPSLDEKQRAAALLRAKRLELGHSETVMAKLIGVSGASINNWEHAKHKISAHAVPAILHRYAVTQDEIAPLLGKPKSTPAPKKRKPEPRSVVVRGGRAYVPAEVAPAPVQVRPQPAAPPDLPAEVRIGVQQGGRIVMSATWEPGTPEGNRMANMTAEMLVNIR